MSDDVPAVQFALIDGQLYRGRWCGHKFLPCQEARQDLREAEREENATLREVQDSLYQGR